MKKSSKRKSIPGQYICIAMYLLMGLACGLIIASASTDTSFILQLIIGVLLLYAAFFIQIIVHEAGHLVFGLLSGYRFVSFRIVNIILIKSDGKLRLCRYSLAGTGGQCLMSPPDVSYEELPYFWYNLGGALMNLIVSVLLAVICLCCEPCAYLSMFIWLTVASGICSALTNGIPLRMGIVDNDGYNALSLGKTPEALRSLAIQLKLNEMQAHGVRIKDMPKEWFEMPDDGAMQNSMTAVMAVMCENRLIDEHRFSETAELIERLLSGKNAIVGMHRALLVCDLIYCKALAGEDVSALLDKQQEKFMKQMSAFLSVIRTEYVLALINGAEQSRLSDIKKRFEKQLSSYPYPADAQSERELVEIIESKHCS